MVSTKRKWQRAQRGGTLVEVRVVRVDTLVIVVVVALNPLVKRVVII